MDLSFRAIHDVVHATAAYAGHGRTDDGALDGQNDLNASSTITSTTSGLAPDWASSSLNPCTRIDSLAPMAAPLWRIDGCAGFGTQFFAFPLFLAGPRPPIHVDVFLDEGAAHAPPLRTLLDLDAAFHTKDASRVARLGITQHLARVLHWHTADARGALRPDEMQKLFEHGPYGSRIVVDRLAASPAATRVVVSPNYPLEGDLLSYQELATLWALDDAARARLPPAIDVGRVRLVRQLHDSISEVVVDGDGDGSPTRLALKSLSSGTKYLYHEIRTLLRDVPPHAHVLSRPVHIVTKTCLFGRKSGVIGFTMPFLEAGSLRDALPLLRLNGRLAFADQLRWARQITEALCHVWHAGGTFYPDLRLDNVVLTLAAPAGDAGLVDFEQRGVWSSFSAPEVEYLENVRTLAFDDQDTDYAIDESVCHAYQAKLVAAYEAARAADRSSDEPAPATDAQRSLILRAEDEVRYGNPSVSYNVSWACLTPAEQESAMVYMLGRLLWCIFEGVSAPHPDAVWQSYAREPELEFPEFAQSPDKARRLVLACFGHEPPKEQSRFRRVGGKLYFCDGPSATGTFELVSDRLAERARAYWQGQLAEGDAWLEARNARLWQEAAQGKARSEAPNEPDTSAYGRPTLKTVLSWIQALEADTN